ncbi:MAG: carboxypeptidase-like regulatory domain-containing protein [Acidobacteriia bacterium]|nr:carboxypeptidase-like regulatory domain-containing protein [Terriglobia bacterium]
MWVFALLLLLTVTSAAQERNASPSGSGGQFRISGTAVNAINDQPLGGAYVTITAVQGAAARTVMTAADGAFRFDGVRAGKYQLSAERRGFASQQYQQHENFSTAIAAGPALDSGNIVFRIVPDASFSGRIADEQGDAVANARVMLIREQVAEGRAIKALVANVATDDQGRYHFGHLKPGAYYLAVSARPWYAQAPGPRGGIVAERGINVQDNSALDVAYPLTFYPDVTDAASASAITLHAGDRASADIMLRVVPALHVRINHATSEGDRQQFANATLVQMIFDGLEVPVQTSTSGMGGNANLVSGIPPGHYLLRVTPNGRRFPRMPQPPSEESGQPARVREVDLVSDTELDASAMTPTATVSGTVKLANGQAPAKPSTIVLRRGAMRRAFDARANAGGEFAFPQGFATGTYEVVMSSGDDLFIRSVTATGAKIAGRMLHISGSDAVKLSVVVSAGTGKIEGVALRDGKPQSGVMILLVPQDPENNLPLFRRDQSDSDGSFTLSPVLPGRYTLLALENGWDLQWSDAAVLKPFLANGDPIVVDTKGNHNLRVKVQ